MLHKRLFSCLAVLALLFATCGERQYRHGPVCLTIKESYGDAAGAHKKLLVEERVKALLEYLGIGIDKEGLCRRRMDIKVVGKALPERYADMIRRYTGAELKVVMELGTADSAEYTRSFGARTEPLEIVSGYTDYASPSDAPFVEALESSLFYTEIALAAGKCYTPIILIEALILNKRVWVKGPRPFLLLPTNHVYNALKTLTKRDFGRDPEKWDLWWRSRN